MGYLVRAATHAGIVAEPGGFVELASEPGRGRATILPPASVVPVDPAVPAPKRGVAVPRAATVLLGEDEALVRGVAPAGDRR